MIRDDLERVATRGPHRDPGEVVHAALAAARSQHRSVPAHAAVASIVALLVAGLAVGLGSSSSDDGSVPAGPSTDAAATETPPNTDSATPTSLFIANPTPCPTVEITWPDQAQEPTMVGATVRSDSIGGSIAGYQLASGPFVFLTRGGVLDDGDELTAEQQADLASVTVNGYATKVRPAATGRGGGPSVRFVFPPTASPADPCNVWTVTANSPMETDRFTGLLDAVDMRVAEEPPSVDEAAPSSSSSERIVPSEVSGDELVVDYSSIDVTREMTATISPVGGDPIGIFVTADDGGAVGRLVLFIDDAEVAVPDGELSGTTATFDLGDLSAGSYELCVELVGGSAACTTFSHP